MSRIRWLAAAICVLALSPSGLLAQEGGTITGQVTDIETGEPLAGVTILVRATNLGTITNANGEYLIANVPAGTYDVNASQIGRDPASQTVTITPGQTASVNFEMGTSAIALEGLVVTATGEERREREIGNAVASVNVAEEVDLASVGSVGEVLAGRAAGVSVLSSSGTSGTGSRIRIRGSASISLDNRPLLIIDGVRADNETDFSIGLGGQTTDRLSDLNAENIESIEVLKGPAASALYGTAAANGVIVVTTKSGVAGNTQLHFYTEQASIEHTSEFPPNFNALDAEGNTYCLIITGCEPAEILSYNPLEAPGTSPFQTGYRGKYGLSVSGGSDLATYFLAGDFENEEGIYKYDLNFLDRVNLRANVSTHPTSTLDLSVNTGYTNSDVRLPGNDNNILGIIGEGLLTTCYSIDPSVSQACADNGGYGFGLDPQEISRISTRQVVERIIGGTSANWRPLSWLSFNGTAGFDRVNRHDNETVPPQQVFFGSLPEGQRTSNRITVSTYTVNANATANYGISTGITASTSAGTQYSEEIFRGTEAFGAKLLAGTESLNGVNARFDVDEDNSQVRTLGYYGQQQLSFNDRIYLTGALRADDNSAFGTDFGFIVYPSISASWVIGEESWFPESNLLSTLRLRAAYGEAGLAPGQLDALTFLSPVAVTLGGESVPAFTIGDVGNPDLEPERSREIELGFDAGFIDDRLGLEFTYYNKTSEDALVSVPLAPSLGLSASQFKNLGEVRNSGVEMLLNALVLNLSNVQWNATVTASWNENELIDLGTDPVTGEEIVPIIFGLGGDSQRHQEGYPLGAYFAQPITYEDANSDGIITVDETTLGDTAVFLGSPFPSREASFVSDVVLFNRVKVSGLLDYRGGYSNFNSTEEFRCGSFLNCAALYDANTSLEAQAAAIGTAVYGTPAGYIEDADFVKLREVALTLFAPENWAQQFFGSEAVSVTVSGRNLATWTDYTGLDPEINFAGSSSNFSTAEFLTQPPVRFFTVRLDLTF